VAKTALAAGVELARTLNAELEVISVISATLYSSPAIMGGPSYNELHDDVVAAVREDLNAAVAAIPYGVQAKPILLEGEPPDQLVERSAGLDLLIMGSRGYGPLRAVLAGGVSGRVTRSAHCPVIVLPRGIEAPLDELFGAKATTSA
jgi:nucleotide-binding universal stress UspA family protein